MRIDEKVFERLEPDFSALKKYGFRKTARGFEYSAELMEGAFRADVLVGLDSRASARVFDVFSACDYPQVDSDSYSGAYIGKVRAEYEGVLKKIAAACFKKEAFCFAQANRLAALIKREYGDSPDFPWPRYPSFGVFRVPANRKWYALFGCAKKSVLSGEFPPDEGAEIAGIVNIKVAAGELQKLLKTRGVYPAYHMNRKNWITILLDSGVPDEFIMRLLGESRRLAALGGARAALSRSRGAPEKWIVPANPQYFDIDAAFKKSRTIIWKQSANILAGDTVYMYVGSPVSAVRYKCEVVKAGIPYSYADSNIKIKRVMKIRLLKTYKPNFLTFAELNKLGIFAVRGARRASEEFLRRAK